VVKVKSAEIYEKILRASSSRYYFYT